MSIQQTIRPIVYGKKPVVLVFGLWLMTWSAVCAERGELAGYSNLFENGISSAIVDTYLAAYGMGELTPVPYGVAVCRVLYWTLDATSRNVTLASGALQIPLTNGVPLSSAMPLLIYAHGTESYRWNVPSCPHNSPTGPYSPYLALNSKTIETLPFSSAGYCVFTPDYAGLGFETNSLVTPYLVADREPIAVIDGIRAAQRLASQLNLMLNDRLFLTGYSQGGHVCLATHRMVEQDYAQELRITAAAPGSAPADLSVSMIEAFRNHLQGGTVFSAFAIAAYQPRFHLWQDFSEVFLPAYTNVPYLFYGATSSLASIAAHLPTNAQDLFTASLIQQTTNPVSVFAQTIASNNVYAWRPLCPITLFYAGSDITVPPSNALIAHAAMQAEGADVHVVNVGNTLDHYTGFGQVQIGVLQYFNQYRYSVSAVGPSDFDGDGRADPAVYDSSTGHWRVKFSALNYAEASLSSFGGNHYAALAADLDGDRKADPIAQDGVNGIWQAELSAFGYIPVSLYAFGASNWPALAADFDGDQRADLAFYERCSNASWCVRLSGSGFSPFTVWAGFGGPTYVPLAADFDGDGKADPAIYETVIGLWQVKLSRYGYMTGLLSGFGGPGYTALTADFDGDGLADPALYESPSGTWYVCLSASGYALTSLSGFGESGYTALAADFDGDGKADPTLWQASSATLAVKLSGSGYAVVMISFQG